MPMNAWSLRRETNAIREPSGETCASPITPRA
jgi:hypothetical protein